MPRPIHRMSCALLLVLLVALVPQPTRAASIVVTSLADSGAGSLRQAIIQANSNTGADTITFSTGGTITLSTSLPALTDGSTTIDGTIPAGGTVPRIEIRGGGSLQGQGLLLNSSNNTIRGLVISGFDLTAGGDPYYNSKGGADIVITGQGASDATGNVIEYCYLGTNLAGDDSGIANNLNSYAGVRLLLGAKNNTIRNNVISGHFNYGILFDAAVVGVESDTRLQTGNVVTNNLIGLNAAGTAGGGNLRNDLYGIYIGNNANSNVIGPGNVISGNGRTNSPDLTGGIYVGGLRAGNTLITGNIIQGNLIGTNRTGLAEIPNNGHGLKIEKAQNTLVGGSGGQPTAAVNNRGNLIAGNLNPEVMIQDNFSSTTIMTGNTLQNNWIGLGLNGTAIGDAAIGVLLRTRAQDVTITDNTIGGHSLDGIQIVGVVGATSAADQTSGNTISNNRIGTSSTGQAVVPNGRYGIRMTGGTRDNTIDGNRITGNGDGGISLDATSGVAPNNNTISTNIIGFLNGNTTPVGNGSDGILITGGSASNTVGPDNTIAGHNNTGILLQDSGTSSNTIRGNVIRQNNLGILTNNVPNNIIGGATVADGNQILNNSGAGISISGASATGNRITRTTTNTNTGLGIDLANGGNRENTTRPTLANLAVSGSSLSGTINNFSACGAGGCTIQVFDSPTALTDEGPNFLTAFLADSASFSGVSIAGCQQFLIFTVTDSAGNTSEFSNPTGPVTCTASGPAVTLTAATNGAATRTVNPGGTTSYTHQLINSGNATGTFQVNYSSTQAAWVTTSPVNGATFSLAAGATRYITVTVTVPNNATVPGSDVTIVRARISGNAASEQTATDTTNVGRVAGVDWTPDAPQNGPQTPSPGSATYNYTLTNTGNGSDSFVLSGSSTTAGVTITFTPPGPITLNAGASTTVQVRVNIPAGVSVPTVTSTIVATSQADNTKSDSAQQNTPIQQTALPDLQPDTAQNGSGRPGQAVTYFHTLRNAGAASGTFRLALAGLPPTWTSIITPSVGTDIPLAAGASRPVTLTVFIPGGAAAPTAGAIGIATITASVQGNSATDTGQDVTTVLLDSRLSLTPDNAQMAGPGETIQYTHTLRNDSNGPNQFTLSVTPPAPGWNPVLAPSGTISLARGESTVVTLTLTVPLGTAPNATPYVATVTARSTDGQATDSATDSTTVTSAAVPLLSPGQTRATDPGMPVVFTHVLTNVGNVDGSFDLTVSGLPAGWTAVIAPTPPLSVNRGASQSFTVTVTPPANAATQTYPFTLRATATDANAATVAVTDRVTINQRADLVLNPNTPADSASTEPPNTVVTYTHTLTNAGNFTDLVQLEARAERPGWLARPIPQSVQLAPGASRAIQIELVIPAGQPAGLTNTTTVTATSSLPPEHDVEQIVTTIASVPGLTIDPPLLLRSGEASTPVTYTYDLINTGSVTQTYALTITSAPAGWTAQIVPLTSAPLAPGQSTTVTVVVTAPAGTPDGTRGDVVFSATSDVAPQPSRTAIARLTVGPPFGAVIAPDRTGAQRPNLVIRYTHTVTNTGQEGDVISLSTRSSLGWETSVAPVALQLDPGESGQVTVQVRVPSYADAGVVDVTTVTARSTNNPRVAGQATDTTTVLQFGAVSFSPSRSATLVAGQRITFRHVVINTGNGRDTFTITATQTLDWPITLVPNRTPSLPRSISYAIEVQVQIPNDVPANAVNRIRVRATSQFDGTVYEEVLDTISPRTTGNEPNPPGPFRMYLPMIISGAADEF